MSDIVRTKLDIVEENFILPSDLIYDGHGRYSADFISKYLLHNKSISFSEYDRYELLDKIKFNINCIFKNRCIGEIEIRKFDLSEQDLGFLYFCIKFPEMIESVLDIISNCDIIFGIHELRTLRMEVDDDHFCTYLVGSIYIQTIKSIESLPININLLNYNPSYIGTDELARHIVDTIYLYIDEKIKSKDKEK